MLRRKCSTCGHEHLNVPGVSFLGRCSECGREVCAACGAYLHAVIHHDCWRRIARHIGDDDLMLELLRSLPR